MDLNINNDYSSNLHHFFRFAVIHAIDLMIVQIFPLQIPVFVNENQVNIRIILVYYYSYLYFECDFYILYSFHFNLSVV